MVNKNKIIEGSDYTSTTDSGTYNAPLLHPRKIGVDLINELYEKNFSLEKDLIFKEIESIKEKVIGLEKEKCLGRDELRRIEELEKNSRDFLKELNVETIKKDINNIQTSIKKIEDTKYVERFWFTTVITIWTIIIAGLGTGNYFLINFIINSKTDFINKDLEELKKQIVKPVKLVSKNKS